MMLAAGIYSLIKEKEDKASVKLASIISRVGILIVIGLLIKLFI